MTIAPTPPVAARRRLPLRKVLVGLLALLVLAVLGVVALDLGRDPVTPENFARLRVGMTGAEVRSIVGRPDFEWSAIGTVRGGTFSTNQDPEVRKREGHRPYVVHQYDGPRMTICVVYDEAGRSACAYSGPPTGNRTSMLAALVRRVARALGR